MILPHTQFSVLVLLFVAALCWGSWPSAFKMSAKWRFELFYFDLAGGFALCALILAFTLGNSGYDGFNFVDDVMNAGKRQWVIAFAAGGLFNLANMLLLSAISLAGMALAFPVWLSLGVATGVIFRLFSKPTGSVPLLLGGLLLAGAAVVAALSLYGGLMRLQHEQRARAGAVKSTRRPSPIKAIALAALGGVILTLSYPVLRGAMIPEIGLGPYAVTVFFALGLVFSTIAFNLFFMNLPVAGEPIEVFDYFKGEIKNHLLGIAGGAILCVAVVAGLAATTANAQTGFGSALAQGQTPVGDAMLYAMPRLAAIFAALWGVLKWKELKDGDARTSLLAVATMALFIGAVAAVAIALTFAPKAA